MRHAPALALLLEAACFFSGAQSESSPRVLDKKQDVTYEGLDRAGVEVFLNIPYGQDTGGANRFKPPRLHVPEHGTVIKARSYGPACPQQTGVWSGPLSLSPVNDISEDCLNLNIARPKGTLPDSHLPVIVWIHGGSFWTGMNAEITTRPDGMILQSVENGTPIIHVAMNYRLGFFGFAQSDALESEGSENAGLRDQRLAIEWVRDNIANFGGDPERITIFGQSSGGLAVGAQILAYGGSKPVPFQQGICESQALEPGITGNFTIDAMQALVDYVGCNSSSLHSAETVACLRGFDMASLLNASLATYVGDIAHNIGDVWLPAVDGDFLPAAPSALVRERRFANVTAMIGWCDNDVVYYTDFAIKTAQDTRAFVASYVPGLTPRHVDELLALYPVGDFAADEAAGLSAEFYRAARVFRDIIMTCQPMWLGENMAAAGSDVFLYDWNQTILDLPIAAVSNRTGLGPVHTSEFAYVFGNLSHYDTNGYPFAPTPADYALERRGARSWATFAATGRPSLEGHDTFRGFGPAFPPAAKTTTTTTTCRKDAFVFVVGGPHEGLAALDGPKSTPAIRAQKLRERCAFINSPEIIAELQY
ncbi:uncharacterized protein E0L32_005110 [Thyridium curvatum]|uniref:Carboxylic ester hydrolase n=1 Tax=Thyridium curvatum TaxID=1093900 RepID=A0A507AV93_9PEZI|nr:uncharacterized protein E0L32_005110 [Thyridium curvatum]TPX14715.1 hypothetical protein E0L32_005110 [Thyridium curvatum]